MKKSVKVNVMKNTAWIKFDITMLIVNLIGLIFQPKYNILAWNVGMLIVVIGLRVCELYVERNDERRKKDKN